MNSQEILILSRSDSILERLSNQLSTDDYLRLRRGLALIEADDECPPTERNHGPIVIDSDPQKMTVTNWPANDEVSR